jgi:hypothetical protein
MRHLALAGLLVSCASPTSPPAAPAPRKPTAREILDALPAREPERALPFRRRPHIVLHAGAFLAWRPFWPLDRIDLFVRPYLAASLHGPDHQRYLEAWRRFERSDPDRALAILSTLAEKTSDPTLRAAARRDLIQVLAATYDPDIAARWLSDPSDFDVLAAEYARQGRTAFAQQLLSTVPLGADERGCELHLNLARIGGMAVPADLYFHARKHQLTGCLEGIHGYLCETELTREGSGAFCGRLPNSDLARRGSLAGVLAQWDHVPKRLASWQYPADLWLDLASTALRGAGAPSWEQVVGDALFNALVVGDCDDRTRERARGIAAAAPRPVGPELAHLTIITTDECRVLVSP